MRLNLRGMMWGACVAALAAGCRPTSEDADKPVQWGKATSYSLDAPDYFGPRADSLEAPMTVEGIALGKVLFTDSSLSADGQVSCQSCHTPGQAFSDPRVVSLGIHGRTGTRNAMALVNLAFQSHFFWDGRARTLEDQILEPMTRTEEMGLSATEIEQKLKCEPYLTMFPKAFEGQAPTFLLARRALGMFIRTLVSSNSKYDQYLKGTYTPTAQEMRGLTLFTTHPDATQRIRGGNCGDCHVPITTAGKQDDFNAFMNNGLDDHLQPGAGREGITGIAGDRGKFKIPSLRNIALTAPYMHDGRFATLEQVLDHYNDTGIYHKENVDFHIQAGANNRYQHTLGLTHAEKADIIVFLHMLTDTTYLHP